MDIIFDVYHILLTLVVVFIGQFVDSHLSKGKRQRVVSLQRDAYFKTLLQDSHKMNEIKLKEEQELVNRIENLRKQNNIIKSQIQNTGGNEWNAETCDAKLIELSRGDKENEAGQLKQELSNLSSKSNQLEIVEKQINSITKKVGETFGDETNGQDGSIYILEERIKQLEAENNKLQLQLETHNCLAPIPRQSELDPKLVKYMEEHDDELTLDFLEKAYETLLELKVSDTQRDFGKYIKELRKNQSNYVAELTQLNITRKEVEKKLEIARSRYEAELSSFNETRVEFIFKNSGAKYYLEGLKERNEIKDDLKPVTK